MQLCYNYCRSRIHFLMKFFFVKITISNRQPDGKTQKRKTKTDEQPQIWKVQKNVFNFYSPKTGRQDFCQRPKQLLQRKELWNPIDKAKAHVESP